MAVLVGCASTNVTQQTPMTNPGLARPNKIWVYDFISDPSRIPADSSISADLSAPSTPPTAQVRPAVSWALSGPNSWWPISTRWVLMRSRPDRERTRNLVMA